MSRFGGGLELFSTIWWKLCALIVPTLRVGMQPGALCVPKRDAERHKRRSHAERGNDQVGGQ
ncbi:hypothetical protein [Pseudomonas sp. 44 R 15]|nr:hypothetical protein [Pseudomonas sp. 44 R 15]